MARTREEINAYRREYYWKNPEYFRKRNKEQYRKHKDKPERKAYHKKYYQDHKEELKANSIAYCSTRREQYQEYHKKYYQENKEEIKLKRMGVAIKEDNNDGT